MHMYIEAKEIQSTRDDRCDDDHSVFGVGKVSHDESDRPHYRWHQHATG